MPLEPRTALHPVSPLLLSSHLRSDGRRARLDEIKGGPVAPADVREGLLRLRLSLHVAGGVLLVTTLHRSYEDQQAAHEADPSNALAPGYSVHHAYRAIDVDVPGSGLTHEAFSRAAAPAGWRAIGNEPWHWEFLGEWVHLYDRHGPPVAAMAMCLDLGHAWYGRDAYRALQAQLHRAGKDCGAIDGHPGPRTSAALAAVGLGDDATYIEAGRLESAPYW